MNKKRAVVFFMAGMLFFSGSLVIAEEKSDKSATSREAELEKLLIQLQVEIRENRKSFKKTIKFLRKCLKKLEDQERKKWLGGSISPKIALLLKTVIAISLYCDYREPAWSYKVAALICLWLL